jgi:3'-5' exoribonuclease
MAFRMIGDKVHAIPGFPDRLRTLIEHIVLSHHGKMEFGSPKVPMFPEAMLFHFLDDMDSKMENMRGLIEQDRLGEGLFTAWSSSLERTVLKKDRFLTEAVADAPVPVPVPAPVIAAEFEPVTVKATGSVFGSKLLDALRDK